MEVRDLAGLLHLLIQDGCGAFAVRVDDVTGQLRAYSVWGLEIDRQTQTVYLGTLQDEDIDVSSSCDDCRRL